MVTVRPDGGAGRPARAVEGRAVRPPGDRRAARAARSSALLEAVLGGPVDGRSLDGAVGAHARERALPARARALRRASAARWPRREGSGAGAARSARRAPGCPSSSPPAWQGLSPAARAALEIAAVGAPLEAQALAAGGARPPLEELEAQGVVELRVDGRRRVVDARASAPRRGRARAARPARAPRRSSGASRTPSRPRERGGAGTRCGSRSGGSSSGSAGAPELFVRAGEQALAALDWPLAERFAAAGQQAGGGFPARLVQARALAGAGRAAEAEELLAALEREAPDAGGARRGRHRPRPEPALGPRARRRGRGRARPGRAGRRGPRAARRARRAAGLAPVRGRPAASPPSRPPGRSSRPPGRRATGSRCAPRCPSPWRSPPRGARARRSTSPRRGCRRRGAIATSCRCVEPSSSARACYALLLSGRLVEATRDLDRPYELQLTARSHENTAVTAVLLGTSGSPADGARRRCAGSARARRCCATRRDRLPAVRARRRSPRPRRTPATPHAAGRAVAEMDAARPPGHRVFEVELELARAWSAAAGGELSRACDLAAGAADRAEADGQDGFAVRALHDLCRLGDAAAAAPRLAALRRPGRGAVRRHRRRARRGARRARRRAPARRRGALRGRRRAAAGRPRRRTPPPRRTGTPGARTPRGRRAGAPPSCSSSARAPGRRRSAARTWTS